MEHTIGDYVFMVDDPLSMRLNAELLAEKRFRSERHVLDWKMTVGLILSRMYRACGLCRSMFAQQRETCIHAAQLEQAARLKNRQINADRVITVCDQQLGSATRRKRMNQRQIQFAQRAIAQANAAIDAAGNERRSIVHRSSYSEGVVMFDRAVIGDPRTRLDVYRGD